jgi:hypothetical protein
METAEEWCDYEYIPGFHERADPALVTHYCRYHASKGKHTNVLCLDGHVELMTLEQLIQHLARNQNRSATQRPIHTRDGWSTY